MVDEQDDMKELFNVRSRLSVSGVLLMYADRMVVLTSLRSEIWTVSTNVIKGLRSASSN